MMSHIPPSKLLQQPSAPNLRPELTEAGFAWRKLFDTLRLQWERTMSSRYFQDILTRPEEARTRGSQLFMLVRSILVIMVGSH